MKFSLFSAAPLILVACSQPNPSTPTTTGKPVASAPDSKICVKNGTAETFYFGVSQKDFGTLKSELEPKSKFCTVLKGTPKVFIRQDKKTRNLCETDGESGLLFTLVDTSSCNWTQEPL